jgi:hypothetical protein
VIRNVLALLSVLAATSGMAGCANSPREFTAEDHEQMWKELDAADGSGVHCLIGDTGDIECTKDGLR